MYSSLPQFSERFFCSPDRRLVPDLLRVVVSNEPLHTAVDIVPMRTVKLGQPRFGLAIGRSILFVFIRTCFNAGLDILID
jgi:hypothetical protein